jgi:hypothetical protein
MKILVEGEIAQAIRRCEPSKIAVAYIGSDWRTFVSETSRLEAIIVSPTFGSNPWAITDLANRLGWDNVYFLDELHAKTYLGNASAVIGSANLTRNGLGGDGLVELCVEVNAAQSLKTLSKTFEDLKQRAQTQYPTPQSKKTRLKELERIWGAAIANRIVRSQNASARSFADFEPLGEDHFYVLWYQPMKCDYSDDVKAVKSLMQDDIHFARADKVEKNKWALVWRITDSSTPHKTVKPRWLYIHDVFEEGVTDEGYEYPKCAIQRKDLEVPTPPFEITDDVSEAFKIAIQEEGIAKYLVQDDRDIFSLAYSLKGIPLLMAQMKEYVANKEDPADVEFPHSSGYASITPQ